MSRFNLTFRGEIIEGHDPDQVRTRLAELLRTDDPSLVERYFSGNPVVLRHNLERKEAAEWYARLRRQGINVELTRIGERGDLHAGDPIGAATLTLATARPAPETPTRPHAPVKREAKGHRKKVARRADLAAGQTLHKEEAALLESKELALQEALREKEREEGRDTAGHRARREEARKRAEKLEQKTQLRAMEEQAIQRAAGELAQKSALKPVESRVRTRLETPSRQGRSGETSDEVRRKRQPGAPNLYSLHPFRNTPGIRARAGESRRIMRRAFSLAAIALAAAAALCAGLLSLPLTAVSGGADAIAIDPRQQPLLLAGNDIVLLDRAGASVSELTPDSLGLAALVAPLAFSQAGDLLAPGLPAAMEERPGQTASPQLMRCLLAESRCEVFSVELAATAVSALAVHPLDGNLFIADSRAGELLKVSPAGAVLARAAADLPAKPVLRLDSGLLLVNSATAPAINVFRYEDEAFGQQLEVITLTPATVGPTKFTGVRDFLVNGKHWWALLNEANREGAGLYRFDTQWQFTDSPGLIRGSRPTQLVDWGSRILVVDPARMPVQRFNSEGAAESPLVPQALVELQAGRERRQNFILLGWRLCLALCLLAAAACLCWGWLHRARRLVYTSCREQGAVPVDEVADSIDWAPVSADRSGSLRRTGRIYTALAAAIVMGAIALSISSLQLSALLLALAGPATALLLWQRSEPGHIGISGGQLLLVDHAGMYHLGKGSRIHHRGPFLMIDDVSVFAGSRLLPAFDRDWITQRVAPVAAGGVKVDCTIVTVKLLQGRHPIALGALAIASTGAAALALLSLQGIF